MLRITQPQNFHYHLYIMHLTISNLVRIVVEVAG